MVLLCVQCAHIHKMHILNPKIPKPRNILMESFSQEEIVEITALCNGRANMVLERITPKNKTKPGTGDPRYLISSLFYLIFIIKLNGSLII
jgi:hypothetical protein